MDVFESFVFYLFGEISVYRSDPRHVTKLMSRRDGLDVVIAAGTRGCDGF